MGDETTFTAEGGPSYEAEILERYRRDAEEDHRAAQEDDQAWRWRYEDMLGSWDAEDAAIERHRMTMRENSREVRRVKKEIRALRRQLAELTDIVREKLHLDETEDRAAVQTIARVMRTVAGGQSR